MDQGRKRKCSVECFRSQARRARAVFELNRKAAVSKASSSLRPNEVPLRQVPDWSLNEREKVVAKNGPFSLTFYQIVALILPHRRCALTLVTQVVQAEAWMQKFDGTRVPDWQVRRWPRD